MISLNRTEMALCRERIYLQEFLSVFGLHGTEFQLRQGNPEPLTHIDSIAEQVGTDSFHHTGNFETLAVHIHGEGLLGRISIVQLGDIPQDERSDEQSQKDRRYITTQPTETLHDRQF